MPNRASNPKLQWTRDHYFMMGSHRLQCQIGPWAYNRGASGSFPNSSPLLLAPLLHPHLSSNSVFILITPVKFHNCICCWKQNQPLWLVYNKSKCQLKRSWSVHGEGISNGWVGKERSHLRGSATFAPSRTCRSKASRPSVTHLIEALNSIIRLPPTLLSLEVSPCLATRLLSRGQLLWSASASGRVAAWRLTCMLCLPSFRFVSFPSRLLPLFLPVSFSSPT